RLRVVEHRRLGDGSTSREDDQETGGHAQADALSSCGPFHMSFPFSEGPKALTLIWRLARLPSNRRAPVLPSLAAPGTRRSTLDTRSAPRVKCPLKIPPFAAIVSVLC